MSQKKLIVFCLLTIGVIFIIGEVFVRLFISFKPIYNVEMVKYAKELKVFDPAGELSQIHRTNASAKLMRVDVALNSMGNRGPELSPRRSPDDKRVLVMGSSITMGWGVPVDRVFTSVIENRLNREKPFGPTVHFQFINAGVGNYNSVSQYLLFKKQYPIVKPDVVVLNYSIRDAEIISNQRNNPIFKFSYLAAVLYYGTQHVAFISGSKTSLLDHYQELYAPGSPGWDISLDHVKKMKAIADQAHIPFIIIICPDAHNLSSDSPYRDIYAFMEKSFKDAGIVTINTFDSFSSQFGKNEKQLWIQFDDPHPNGRGHQLMADELYDVMVRTDSLGLLRR